MTSIEEMYTFCKKKGFVFPNSEIYGGLSGFYDYGPMGVEMKNNIKNSWWKRFVTGRRDVVGIDGCIISHQKVWQASGHVACFTDVMVEDTKTNERYRADLLVADALGIQTDGMKAEELWQVIQDNNLTSPKGNPLSAPKQFNLMFKTTVGPVETEQSTAYLRPETAQLIFANFKAVCETSRMKLPFGIAQIGKAFRNEISPRDFLFRVREFEQMEIEFFLRPDQMDDCAYLKDVEGLQVNLLSQEAQEKGNEHSQTTIGDMVKQKKCTSWHGYWLGAMYQWFMDIGISPEKLRLREHLKEELSHYSSATFDIEYHFPFGWKEIHGNANRGNFDLTQHREASKQNLEIFDEENQEKILPHVIEPSQGVDRAFLALLYEGFTDDKERGNIVLRLPPNIAPYQVGIFSLVKKLKDETEAVFDLVHEEFACFTDHAGTIGRRYARADELGVPYCVTFDFDSLQDKKVTVRDRDSTTQIRVAIDSLPEIIGSLIKGAAIETLGEQILPTTDSKEQ